MSPYLIDFAELVWAWIFAPPLHWAMSLRLEWQIELSILALLCALHRPLIEYWFVGRDAVGDWWEDRKWNRDWYYLGKMSSADFHEAMARIHALAGKEDDRASYLERRAGTGFISSVLRKAAARREERADWLREEANRLKSLWDRIQSERRAEDVKRQRREDERRQREGDKRRQREEEERRQQEEAERRRKTRNDGSNMRDKVLSLMRKLESGSEVAAVNALSELNRIRAQFDWESLAPVGISQAQRQRLVSVLTLMAGTTSLGEARNALRSARVVLEQNHCDWQWEPA
jgi:hypothetical protein